MLLSWWICTAEWMRLSTGQHSLFVNIQYLLEKRWYISYNTIINDFFKFSLNKRLSRLDELNYWVEWRSELITYPVIFCNFYINHIQIWLIRTLNAFYLASVISTLYKDWLGGGFQRVIKNKESPFNLFSSNGSRLRKSWWKKKNLRVKFRMNITNKRLLPAGHLKTQKWQVTKLPNVLGESVKSCCLLF